MPRANRNTWEDCVSPSIRREFVKRAAALKRKPAFRRAMEAERRAWDHAWPQFAIGEPVPPPDKQYWVPNDYPVPGKLARALEEYNRWLQNPRRDRDADGPGEYSHTASAAWRAMLTRLCHEWWPPEIYPNWVCPWEANPIVHPAWRFVAACLLWQTRCVPEEWIAAYGLGPVSRNYDPSAPASHGQVMFLRTLCQGLYDSLARRFADSPEQLAVLEAAVDDAYTVARQGPMDRARLPQQPDRWYFPLYPGLTTTDWRRCQTLAIAQANSDGSRWDMPTSGNMSSAARRRRARELYDDQSQSLQAISDLLGRSPRQIGRLIHGDEPLPD
jgi:hypothetical protein